MARIGMLLVLGFLCAAHGWQDLVEDYDFNDGADCEKLVLCPTMCVADTSKCPEACEEGETLCPDGFCHVSASQCEGVPNICQCDTTAEPTDLKPCKKTTSAFDSKGPKLTAKTIRPRCAEDMGVKPEDLLECPKVAAKNVAQGFSWQGLLGWVTLVILLLTGVWVFLKLRSESDPKESLVGRTMKASLPPLAAASTSDGPTISAPASAPGASGIYGATDAPSAEPVLAPDDVEVVGGMTLQQVGYRDHPLGTALFNTVLLISLGLFVIMVVLVVLGYGITYWRWRIYSHPEVSASFILTWHVKLVWFLALKMYEPRIRNACRFQCNLEDATSICIQEDLQEEMPMGAKEDRAMKLVASMRECVVKTFGIKGNTANVSVKRRKDGIRFFEYKCVRYAYSAQHSAFVPCNVPVGRTHDALHKQSEGLTKIQVGVRTSTIGANEIPFQPPTMLMSLVDEFSQLFYLYQMLMMWVWLFFDYLQVALILLVVILIAGLLKSWAKRKQFQEVASMTKLEDTTEVLRDGEWAKVESTALVPGDVIQLEAGNLVPCDAALLKGSVVLDESMLTGEAMPVQKFALDVTDSEYKPMSSSKNHAIFAGTKVVDIQTVEGDEPPAKGEVNKLTAIVVETGIRTEKGRLIHRILFPQPVRFVFDEHMKVVIMILFVYGIIGATYAMKMMNRGDIYVWFYAIFTISQLLPPLLPATLVMGQNVAMQVLKKKDIICLDFSRITVAGNVRVLCTDKTGTLTKEGLDYHGVQPASMKPFGKVMVDQMALEDELQMALACCHDVAWAGDTLVGPMVDLKMFQASGWLLSQDGNTCTGIKGQLKFQRRLHFDRTTMTMTAVVERKEDTEEDENAPWHVFSKGSYESIKALCKPDSVPANFDEIAGGGAKEGKYVLGLCHRTMEPVDKDALPNMPRADIEKPGQATLLGLVLFHNDLKEDTASAIEQLKEGDVSVHMITGDNALTGAHIARLCGIIPGNMPVVLGDLPDPAGPIVWANIDSGETCEEVTLYQEAPTSRALALTGTAFDRLLSRSGPEDGVLLRTKIYARMKPDQKVQCVQCHMQTAVTAMVGDGGNDCGALRAAHAGIALSDAEASVTSPFTSKSKSMLSVVDLVREGRAALATSMASYKFLIMYGQVYAVWKLVMYYYGVVLGEYCYILTDFCFAVLIAYTLTKAESKAKLYPGQPTASLLGPETMWSVCGQVFLSWLFMLGIFVVLNYQSFYACNKFDRNLFTDLFNWRALGDNYEAENIYIVASFEQLAAAAAFNIGSDFRQPWVMNKVFVLAFMTCFLLISFLTLSGPNPLTCMFRINCSYDEDWWYGLGFASPLHHNIMPEYWRGVLWCTMTAYMLLVFGFEYFFVQKYLRSKPPEEKQAYLKAAPAAALP